MHVFRAWIESCVLTFVGANNVPRKIFTPLDLNQSQGTKTSHMYLFCSHPDTRHRFLLRFAAAQSQNDSYIVSSGWGENSQWFKNIRQRPRSGDRRRRPANESHRHETGLTLPQLCQNYLYLCVRIGKIDRLRLPLNAWLDTNSDL